MTVDEKAASYTNWKPDQLCGELDCGHKEAKHSAVGWAARVPHNIPIPDMNLCQSWKVALNTLVHKYGAVQITLTAGSVSIVSPGLIVQGIGNSWVEALGDFWDQEHRTS